jgi:hypothetical protein
MGAAVAPNFLCEKGPQHQAAHSCAVNAQGLWALRNAV